MPMWQGLFGSRAFQGRAKREKKMMNEAPNMARKSDGIRITGVTARWSIPWFPQVVSGAGEDGGLHDDVGVGEEEQFPRGSPAPRPEGVGLAEPAGRKLRDVNGLEAGIVAGQFVHDGAGGVVGAVIHHDQFIVGVVEPEEREERLADVPLLVAGRDDHRNLRGRGGEIGGDVAQEPDRPVAPHQVDGHDQVDQEGRHGQPEERRRHEPVTVSFT